MISLFIECLLWGASCGIIGGVYRGILASEEVFNFWWQYGARYEGRWFFKPVWSCGHCTAGQLALWSFLLLRILPATVKAIRLNGGLYSFPVHYATRGATALFCLILTISAAIAVGRILSWYFQKKFK